MKINGFDYILATFYSQIRFKPQILLYLYKMQLFSTISGCL